MRWPEQRASRRQRCRNETFGLIERAALRQGVTQFEHVRRGLRTARSSRPLVQIERAAQNLDAVSRTAAGDERTAEQLVRVAGFSLLAAECAVTHLDGAPRHILGFVESSEIEVHEPDGVEESRLERRLRRE